jgi:hypothetical protein
MQNDPLTTRDTLPEQRVINYRPERPGLQFQRQEDVILAPTPLQPQTVAPPTATTPLQPAVAFVSEPLIPVPKESVAAVAPAKRKSFTLVQAGLIFMAFVALGFAGFLVYNAVIA